MQKQATLYPNRNPNRSRQKQGQKSTANRYVQENQNTGELKSKSRDAHAKQVGAKQSSTTTQGQSEDLFTVREKLYA